MSNPPRSIPRGSGGKSEDEPDFEPVVFPPLMSTLDVYMDASSDVRYNQIVEKVKANKKKATRKVKKKSLQSNVVQMEPLVNLAEANQARPESRVASSDGAPRTQFRLRNYSTPSGDREDYNFDSVSLESASKTAPIDRKVHISSPPPSSDRKQGGRPNFTPYSPARILVQPSSQTGFSMNKSAVHRSPPEGLSPGSQRTHAPVKSDLGFGKAVESIAAIKLHNFAMKRRDHVSQKLKLLREIRSMQKENEADFVEAKKLRKDEVLAAWKIRYYVEYLRLNSLRHIVDHTTQKNLELEEECSLLQQTAAVAEIENESLAKEIARLTHAHADATTALELQSATWQGQIQDLTYQLQAAQRNQQQSEEQGKETQSLLVQARVATMQEQQQIERLQSELNITRMTCQELVKAAAQKDTEIQSLSGELHALRKEHTQYQKDFLLAQAQHSEERETSRMREEDNEIRHMAANALHATLHDAERKLRTYETDFDRMSQEVLTLQEKLSSTSTALSTERATIAGIEQEKSGLQKLLSELAKRLTQADEDKTKAHSVEKQHKSDLKTANNTIATLKDTIGDLEAQLNAAHDEIEFLVEENHELAREMECHHMYGEEMDQRHAVASANAERSLEYSRFLEEELFCARKLYEKSSAHYNDIAHMGSGNHHNTNNNAAPMFGDVSEESYGYRSNENAANLTAPATATAAKSSIEQFTGLQPVEPITVMHLNSFGRGARSGSRNGRNEFERPHSASMYNPDSRPNSTGNSTIMAEQRLLMVLNTIEERMKHVDRAADSLRFLAEKADAIEKVQSSTATILQTANTAAALARQPVRLSVLQEQQAAEKKVAVEKHISLERVFSELQASLDQVNADLSAQQATILQLQERRAECKETASNMKKRLRKSRKASVKDPSTTFFTEDEENQAESQMNQLNNEIEHLKEQINTYKNESENLNTQSISLQTQLYHLDQDLEKSAAAFLAQFNEHVTAYYPAEMAHLIEDGHAEEHGRFTITAPLGLQLNTLYEEDEEGTGSVVTSNSNTMPTNSSAGAYFNTSASVTSGGMESGVALEHSLELNPTQHNDNSSMDEMSEMGSSYFLDSPTARKKPKKSKSRRSSEAYSSEDVFEQPSSRERKASKLPKMHKQKSSKSRKNRSKSGSFGDGDGDGDTEEGMEGTNLEEGSSDTVDAVNSVAAMKSGIYDGAVGGTSLHNASNTGSNSSGVAMSLDRNESVYNVPSQHPYNNHAATGPLLTTSGDSYEATPRWNSPFANNFSAGLSSHNGSPYYPPYALANPISSPSASRGRPHSEADRAARQQQHAAREKLAHLRADLETHITQLDDAIDAIEVYETQRVEVRARIVQWVAQYVALCGCAPSVEDRLRSTTLQPHLHAFNNLQTDLQLAYSQATNVAEAAVQLRSQLLHEQHSQHSSLPMEQLEEQLALLYPISAVGELYLEDPIMIPGDEELAAIQPMQQGSVDDHMYSGTDAVSELSASLQGSLTLPSSNTSGNYYQHAGPAVNQSNNSYYYNGGHPQQATGNPQVQRFNQNLEESSITSEASSKSEKKARKAAKKAAKRSKSSKNNKDFPGNADVGIGYDNNSTNNADTVTAESSVNSGTEEDDFQRNQHHSHVPTARDAGGNEEHFATAQPNVEPSYASYPTTPFSHLTNNLLTTLTAQDFAALSDNNTITATHKSTKSNVIANSTWAGMFADPVATDTEALQAEQAVLNAELKEWAANYSAKHGRKPVPSDYDSFDTDIKAKIYRKNYIKKVLKDDSNSVASGLSGVVTDSPTAAWRAKQMLNNNNTAELSPAVLEDKPSAPVYDINTDSNIYNTTTNNSNAVANSRHHTEGDSQSGFSLPATPFLQNRNLHGDTSEEFFDVASLQEQLSSGKVTVESLLQEQTALREDVRLWTQEFIDIYGRKPAVEDFQSFDTDIKLKLIRKNQIKKLLLDFGITNSVSRKYGASSDFNVVAEELSEEQLEAIRTGRPSSTSAKEGMSSRGRSSSPSAKGRSGKSRGRTPDRARSSSKKRSEGSDREGNSEAEGPLQLPSYPASTDVTVITGADEVVSPHDALAIELQRNNANINGSRASTAQSINSAYSVPTTPYADQFSSLEGTERTAEDNINVNDTRVVSMDEEESNSMYDKSLKIPNSSITTEVNTHLNAKHLPIAQLEAELKAVKKELRKWNINFMRQYGRLPEPEDFPHFEDEVKEKLQRKRYLSMCISDANWDNTNTAVSDPLITNGSYEGEQTATTTGDTAVETAAHTTSSSLPNTDDISSAPDAFTSTTTEGNFINTNEDIPSDLAAATIEFNTIKATLKEWQQDFIAMYRREPQEDDLPQDVIDLGERRNALKMFIKAQGGSVSSRVSSAAGAARGGITIDTKSVDDTSNSVLLSPTKPTSAPNSSNGRPRRNISNTNTNKAAAEPTASDEAKPTATTPASASVSVSPMSNPSVTNNNNYSQDSTGDRAISPKTNKRVSFIASMPAESINAEQNNDDPIVSAIHTVNVGSIAPVSVEPNEDTAVEENGPEAINEAADPPTGDFIDTPMEYNIPELTKEYAKIKKQLKKWQKEFVQEHNREPNDEDFDSVDESLKELIVRKYELKDILGELGESPSKSKKSKKSKKDAQD